MASSTDICNLALAYVGSKSIINLNDDDKRARLCKQLYPICRDELLRSHPWNFAIEEKDLAQLTSKPKCGFTRKFALPADFLRLIQLQSRYIDYRLEGGEIHTDEKAITIKYIAIIEDSERFDSAFTVTLSYRIAKDLAFALADDSNLHNLMTDQYRRALANARSMDAQENPATVIYADEWLDSRR